MTSLYQCEAYFIYLLATCGLLNRCIRILPIAGYKGCFYFVVAVVVLQKTAATHMPVSVSSGSSVRSLVGCVPSRETAESKLLCLVHFHRNGLTFPPKSPRFTLPTAGCQPFSQHLTNIIYINPNFQPITSYNHNQSHSSFFMLASFFGNLLSQILSL